MTDQEADELIERNRAQLREAIRAMFNAPAHMTKFLDGTCFILARDAPALILEGTMKGIIEAMVVQEAQRRVQ